MRWAGSAARGRTLGPEAAEPGGVPARGRSLVLATRNPGKVRELRDVLGAVGVRVVGLEAMEGIPEPPETGATFADNAADKALYYARATGLWALADDSGLEVQALGGAPGVHSARYAASECPPGASRDRIAAANNAKLLAAMADIPAEARAARFVCCVALADPRRVLLEARGEVAGVIADRPRGAGGFGYDPLFLVPASGRTTAEMGAEEKNRLSHRGKAVREFVRLLGRLLADDGSSGG